MMRRSRLPLVLLFLLSLSAWARAGEPFRYPEGKFGRAELRYVNGLPVLTVEGTPEEMGEQTAALTAKPAARLFNYPRDFLKAEGLSATGPALVLAWKSMLPRFPADYRRELEPGAKA